MASEIQSVERLYAVEKIKEEFESKHFALFF